MNTRQYADRYTAKRLLRSPVYQDAHARHVAQVAEMQAGIARRNSEIATLKAQINNATDEVTRLRADVKRLESKTATK